MRGTVKEFKDILDEMKGIYPYEDEKTWLSTHNILTREPDSLEIATVDETTGISIVMAKRCEVRKEEY